MMTQILESHLKEIEDVLASEMNNFNLKQEKKQTYKYLIKYKHKLTRIVSDLFYKIYMSYGR